MKRMIQEKTMQRILMVMIPVLFLWNCGEDTIPGVEQSPYDIYAAGSYLDNSAMKACYWINGERKDLLTNTAAGETSYASDIVKVSNYLYISGSVLTSSGIYKSYYWSVNLTNNSVQHKEISKNYNQNIEMYSIAVGNNKVYIVGYFQDEGSGFKLATLFWNTFGYTAMVRTSNIVGNITDSFVYGVFVFTKSGATLPKGYAAGKFIAGTDSTAFYWVEGEGRKNLSSKGKSSAQAICVQELGSNEFRYIAGHIQSNESYRACYWIDSGITIARQDIHPDGALHSYANDIYVSDDGTVYITGSYDTGLRRVPCYWINGVRTDIAEMPGTARRISVVDGKVFTAGFYQPFFSDTACYWIDDQRFDLGNGTNSRANGIVVEKKAE